MKKYAFGYINNYCGFVDTSLQTPTYNKLGTIFETKQCYSTDADRYVKIYNGELVKIKRDVVEKKSGKSIFEEFFGGKYEYAYESYPLLGEVIDDKTFEDIITGKRFEIEKEHGINEMNINELTKDLKVHIKETSSSIIADKIKRLSKHDLRKYSASLTLAESLINEHYYEVEKLKQRIIEEESKRLELENQNNIESELFLEEFKKNIRK